MSQDAADAQMSSKFKKQLEKLSEKLRGFYKLNHRTARGDSEPRGPTGRARYSNTPLRSRRSHRSLHAPAGTSSPSSVQRRKQGPCGLRDEQSPALCRSAARPFLRRSPHVGLRRSDTWPQAPGPSLLLGDEKRNLPYFYATFNHHPVHSCYAGTQHRAPRNRSASQCSQAPRYSRSQHSGQQGLGPIGHPVHSPAQSQTGPAGGPLPPLPHSSPSLRPAGDGRAASPRQRQRGASPERSAARRHLNTATAAAEHCGGRATSAGSPAPSRDAEAASPLLRGWRRGRGRERRHGDAQRLGQAYRYEGAACLFLWLGFVSK